MKLKNLLTDRPAIKIAAVSGALIIGVTGILYYNDQTDRAKDEKKEILNTISELKIKQITSWKNERLGDAYVLAESPIFIKAVKNWLACQSDTMLKKMIIKRLEAFKKAFSYKNLFITTPDGRLLLSVEEAFLKPDKITLDFIKKTTAENRLQYTGFYYCPTHSEIHFDVIVPLSGDAKKPFALLTLRSDPDRYIYTLLQSWPAPSRTGETLLVTQEGDYVLFINRLKYIDNSKLDFRIPLSEETLPAAKAIKGYTGFFEGLDYRGAKVLAYLERVPDTEWYLITKIDRNEIYSDLHYRQYFIILFMILSFITLIAFISYISSYRESEFYKQKYIREKEIKEKQDEFRTILYSIGDAVIITDPEGKIRNINKAAETLTGWTEAEATGKKFADIIKIFNEKIPEDSENPVSKILNEGKITVVDDSTVLRSKNGTDIPVSNSGSAIIDEYGKVTGVILILHDRTAEKESRLKIMQSEERFRNALDDMLEGCQIIGFDWKYIYCNSSSIKIYRIDKHAPPDLTIKELFPGTDNSALYRDMELCMHRRQRLKKEYEFTFPDSSRGFLDLSIHPAPEGIFVLTLDTTEKKKIENELIRKSRELESIFENMINAFVIWESVFDSTGKYVSFRFGYFNRAYSKISGVEQADVMDKNIFEVWPDTEQSWVDIYGDVAVTGKSRNFEMYHKPTDGYYNCIAYRPTDSMDQVCVIFEDITERKKNEEIIRKGLEEKETLIRELYHRTKNNMQVIYGILELQSEMSGNEEFKLLVQDINNRIMSMSLVHQMLYKARNLSMVNLRDYITELTSLLTSGFSVNEEKIKVFLNLEPVSVRIDTAIPCGLILNELISNVFKHAFPNGMNGKLTVNLERQADGEIKIDVSDNGIGVKDRFDYYRQQSLGLKLIISITEEQLNGSVEFSSDAGMKCVIRFSETEKSPVV